MNWYINDLSLRGQFPDAFAFRAALEPLMKAMSRRDLSGRVFCTRKLSQCMITAKHSLPGAVRALGDAQFVSLVLRWIDRNGPFWDEDRTHNPDDLFFYETCDVTDEGLGEAARRLVAGLSAGSFSFWHETDATFAYSPLRIVHGLLEQPYGEYDVENVWRVEDLPNPAVERATSWTHMIHLAKSTLTGLRFSPGVIDRLLRDPFNASAAERIGYLLRVLQRLYLETTADGAWTPDGMKVYEQHFIGDKAAFSDSSDNEKRNFRTEMTFPDPSDLVRSMFCPWHGKAKCGGQYRIHFEYPRPRGQREFKIGYVGPKITKY
jgi:hypothetical protein